jgi:hypothetical protein
LPDAATANGSRCGVPKSAGVDYARPIFKAEGVTYRGDKSSKRKAVWQMAFVRLNRSGQSVWINSDRIAYFEPVESLAQDGSKRAETKVCFDSDMSIVVDEPIDQIRHRFQ